MDKPFQRKEAKSNTQAGKDFERKTKALFSKQGLILKEDLSIQIGINGKKAHSFDLGNHDKKFLVECKSHTWTEVGNIPSAKITTWDQAMYFFYAAPSGYRKVFFVLKDWSPKKQGRLASYYVQTKEHLIPKDVEVWEFDDLDNNAKRIK